MTRRGRQLGLLVLGTALSCGCSEDDEPVTIEVTVGWEEGVFQAPPEVVSLEIKALDAGLSTIASATTTPGGTFNLGDVTLDQLLHIHVHGRDTSNTERMTGRSLAWVPGALETRFMPVFVQRIGEFARPPRELTHSHVNGVGGVIGERFLFVTGGTANPADADDHTVAFYDMLALGGSTGFRIERVPRSLVVSADGHAMLVIDEQGASWIDLNDSSKNSELPLPDGLPSFAEVAGGRTVDGPDASYVVGATRADPPSAHILVVNKDRSISAAVLDARRAGAAATWVPEGGLAIAGGNATVKGVHVLATGATEAILRDFTPDAVAGAGASAGTVEGELVLVCGRDGTTAAPPRSLNLNCSVECEPDPLTLDIELGMDQCSVYKSGGVLIAIGSDVASGETRAFEIITSTRDARPLPLKEPRRGAVAVPAPNGTLCLLGGEDATGQPKLTIECFMP
jgi:hypothetical protein